MEKYLFDPCVFAFNQSPVKKQILTAETQAYDMGTGIDPTMTYDMLENKDKVGKRL